MDDVVGIGIQHKGDTDAFDTDSEKTFLEAFDAQNCRPQCKISNPPELCSRRNFIKMNKKQLVIRLVYELLQRKPEMDWNT
jgi:hypothetical protein